MRNTSLAVATLAVALATGRAAAAPFDPATIPETADVVGHLDVDLVRRTQLFTAIGGQAAVDVAVDEALDGAPAKLRPIARSLSRSIRSVSFWRAGDHGAVHVDSGDSRSLGQLIGQIGATPAPPISGFPTYVLGDDGDSEGFGAVYGQTLVLADSRDGLERSIRVLTRKAPSLAGSGKLPAVTGQGVFVFVTLGDDALGAIQKSAHAKVLQLGLRSLVLDAGESGHDVIARARAELQSADAVDKARTILEGVRALASISEPSAKPLLDAVTLTVSGLTLTVTAKLPVAEAARLIRKAR